MGPDGSAKNPGCARPAVSAEALDPNQHGGQRLAFAGEPSVGFPRRDAAASARLLRRPAVAAVKRESIPIASIYVPTKRRTTLDPVRVEALAQDILQVGQQVPILVRRDGERFVLVEGLHRLEACKALGETTIFGYLVQARKH